MTAPRPGASPPPDEPATRPERLAGAEVHAASLVATTDTAGCYLFIF